MAINHLLSSQANRVNLQGEKTLNLQMRWHGIRLQEIKRQLYTLTNANFFVTTESSIQSPMLIQISPEALTLPIEVLAAITAHAWYENMQAIQMLEDKRLDSVQFVADFLARFNYRIERVMQFCLNPDNQDVLLVYPFLKQHVLSMMLAFQKASLANIKRKSRVKAKRRANKIFA